MKANRVKRIRAKISGVAERPRVAVFRSNTHIYAQLIDDQKGVTLASASDFEIKENKQPKEKAFEVGKNLAAKAKEKKIKKAVYDRHGYQYLGQVKALAEGLREGGLEI